MIHADFHVRIYSRTISLSLSLFRRLFGYLRPASCVHRLCRDRAVKWRENTSRSGEVERAGNGRGDKENQPLAYRALSLFSTARELSAIRDRFVSSSMKPRFHGLLIRMEPRRGRRRIESMEVESIVGTRRRDPVLRGKRIVLKEKVYSFFRKPNFLFENSLPTVPLNCSNFP